MRWAADAAEVLLIGFALPSIREEFGLDGVTSALLASVTFVGMLLGAWLWGPVADRIGRRLGFMVTVGIFAVFGLASAFAPTVGWLLVLRLLTGFGLGGALPLDFSIYAEYLPSRNRGRNLVLLESFWALGTIAAAGLAWLLVPTFGWRPLLATSALAALLVFWIRARLFALAPNTPLLLTGGIVMSAFSLGAWGGLYAYTPELYPTVVRGTGFGAASGLSRIGGATAPLVGGALLATTLVVPLAVYAVAFLVAGVAVWALGVETRDRSLPDVVAAASTG